MATFKCDIKKQFGKFSAHVWKASDKPAAPVIENEEALVTTAEAVVKAVKKAGFAEGDEVIFRDNAYNSLAELRGVLTRSPY